ncbi:RNA polymerase subunit sigma, partial [bacterium]|nr:RNA polymerase subunit sigma [bacterium]
RDVITLRYIDGMTYEEIAAATAVSIGTVKSRISRSKKMLADLLEDDI